MAQIPMNEWLAIAAIFGIPFVAAGVAGGWVARGRGLNPVPWALLSGMFPIFIMIVYFKKPVREVPGRFRKCSACGEYYPWKLSACKYCGTAV